MLANILVMLSQQAPQYFDIPQVLETALNAIGADPTRYIIRPDQSGGQPPTPPDPKVVAATIKQQTDQQKGISDANIAQGRIAVEREKIAAEVSKSAADNATAVQVAHMKASTDTAAPYHDAIAHPPPEPLLP
jgi:hypothetical protein